MQQKEIDINGHKIAYYESSGTGRPVLFIHGTADQTVPFEMGLQLYRKSGGNKRFVAIDGGGHENNAQVGGPVFRSAIAKFVAESTRAYSAPVLAAK